MKKVNKITIHPSKEIKGTVNTPASKSHAQRALACALLNPNQSILHGLGQSDDERAVLGVLRSLGAHIEDIDDVLKIHGVDFSSLSAQEIFIGESGLASRMLTPVLGLAHNNITIQGCGSILQRPMGFFADILPNLNVQVSSNHGKLPLTVQGPLIPKDISVDGSMSSQFITGLMMAYLGSPHTKKELILIDNPKSIPYINLTIQTLQNFGHDVQFDGTTIYFDGPYKWKPTEVHIERDWSSAAFFIVAAALFGTLSFDNLNMNSTQADKAILDIVKAFGAHVSCDSNRVTITHYKRQHFHFDATHAPDLFPILAVLAAYGTQTSSIKGVHRLIHKESNRVQAILTEFSKFGAAIEIENDTMFITPREEYRGAAIDPHGDHRMVMAAAIFAIGAKEKTTLLHPEVCAKSFPNFFEVLGQLY